MKKILIIHTNYQIKGGEDIAVEKEVDFLKKKYEVKTLIFSNEIENRFFQSIYFLINKNLKSMKSIKNELENFNPDVVYVHNTWFKASLGLFSLLSKKNIKVIIKLHNFRYFCSRTLFLSKHLNNHNFCGACGIKNQSNYLFNKYYENSFLKSLFLIRYGKKYFKILKKSNFSLLVLTNFHREFLIDNNFDPSNIYVFPNYIDLNLEKKVLNKEQYIVYAGRISYEKGVEDLIKAHLKSTNSTIQLKIVGKGPDLPRLIDKYKDPRIVFLGEKTNDETLELIKESKAAITATKIYEGQPTLLCEASSFGIPSIFPRTGGIEEFFPKNYDLSFEQYNYEDLKTKIDSLNYLDLSKIGKLNLDYLSSYLNSKKLYEKYEKIINEN